MKKTLAAIATVALLLCVGSSLQAGSTANYGGLTLDVDAQTRTHFSDVWDLTQGNLTLSYRIDMSGLTQPNGPSDWTCSPWIEVGIHESGSPDFNPGPWDTYQGGKGGWVISSISGNLTPSPDIQTIHDSSGLSNSGGRWSAGNYDVLLPNPRTVVTPFGTGDNYGFWADRDSVDQWQDDMWGAVNGKTYNTGGVYDIVVTYRAISAGLGTMFMTLNGVQQGFYTSGWRDAQPDKYPAGLSWKGDMTRMQVFAGVEDSWDPANASGRVILSDITVQGVAVPEPATLALMGLAILGLAGLRRK